MNMKLTCICDIVNSPVKRRNPAYQRRIAKRHAMRQTEHHSNEAEEASVIVNEDILNEADKPVLVDDTSLNDSERAVQVQSDIKVDLNEHSEEELDADELARDKLVDQVIVYIVPPSDCRKKLPDLKKVEEEIRERFASIGAQVIDMKIKSSSLGKFESSLVKITPINLKLIWGRRLGLQNWAVVEFKKPMDNG